MTAAHRKRLVPLAGLACALGLVVPLTAGAAGGAAYTDPAGDAGGAPDIQRVVVSNTNTGLLRFELTYANRSALGGEDGVFIALDSDRNRDTGDPDGSEWLIFVDAQSSSAAVGKWNGETYDFDVPQTTFRQSGGRTIEIDRKELGDVSAFDFFVGSFDGEGEDYGPDDPSTVYTYELDFTPELRSVSAAFKPAPPRAGRVFALRALELTTDTAVVKPDRRTCTAKLGGRTLRPLRPCTWRLPKNAKRKLLVVTVRVTYKGVSGTADPYRFRVR